VNHEEAGHLGLTDREIDDVVAFLQTLTAGWQPTPRQSYCADQLPLN
jgi:hypothetical protein